MSKQVAWKNVRINIGGRTLVGVKGVKYSRKSDKTPLYGRGSKPLGIQSGNQSFEGTITLYQNELDVMIAEVKQVNPYADLTDAVFDIVVAYGEGIKSKVDTLLGCEISEYEKGMEQNDPNMEIELKFQYLDLKEE
jgi:hypothetical protein